MHVVVEIVYFVVSLFFIGCVAQTGKKWPDEVFVPPYHLLSVRAEKYILPILPYELGALEPYIDKETVVAHYEGHHEAYRRKMNVALNSWREDVSFAAPVRSVSPACIPHAVALCRSKYFFQIESNCSKSRVQTTTVGQIRQNTFLVDMFISLLNVIFTHSDFRKGILILNSAIAHTVCTVGVSRTIHYFIFSP